MYSLWGNNIEELISPSVFYSLWHIFDFRYNLRGLSLDGIFVSPAFCCAHGCKSGKRTMSMTSQSWMRSSKTGLCYACFDERWDETCRT